MTKKQIGRTIAFALVVCLLLLLLCDVFELADNTYISSRFKTFYNLNEDTLDAVWIGTSGVDRYWIAAKAYEEYGMTVFPLSSDEMAAWTFTDVAKEALQKQKPKLLIVDLRAFSQVNNDLDVTETRSRRVLDAMKPFSLNRLNIAFKTMDIINQIDSEKPRFDLSYLFSFIKYHPIWAEDDFSLTNGISHKECPYMGFFMYKTLSIKTKDQSLSVYKTNYFKELDDVTEKALYELLDFIEQENLDAIFINTPGRMTKSSIGRVNTTCKILDEHGIDYINYCITDKNHVFTNIPDLDYVEHFYNRHHVNYYGAEKFTELFAAYLNENYNFEDHRTDEAVKEDWDGVYTKIKDKIQSWEKAKAKAEAGK